MTNKSAVFFSCEGDDVVDFAAELARKGFSITVVNSKKATLRFSRRNIKYTFTKVASVASVLDGIAQSSMECCVVVMSKAGPLTLETAAQSSALRRIVLGQYNSISARKCWVVLDYADLETVATMVDDEDPTRVLSYINSKVLKHTAEVDCRIAAAIADSTFPAPPLESVLVLGSGGREHAIVHALRKSPLIGCVYVSPGNYGTAHECDDTDIGEFVCENVPVMSTAEVVEFAVSKGVSMVIVGPEKPLVDGVADALREKKIACFGPSKQASQIEASKAWSKEFMRRHNLPTAAFRAFSSAADFSAAQVFIESVPHRVVVKASGLADGKGVLLPTSTTEAVAAVHSMLVEGAFGQAGSEVVVEQFLQGEEVSILAFCDGTTAVGMPPAQDHKRALDGDQGLNTGGMGAYAPTPLITPKQYQACMKIVQDTVSAMATEGVPFIGVLYAGFILTAGQGPMLLEYNCRFGDPETQVLLPLLESDLYDICKKCAQGGLQESDVTWSKQTASTIVCTAPGYPEPNYPRGAAVTGLDTVTDMGADDNVKVYHAGTAAAVPPVCPAGVASAVSYPALPGRATGPETQGGCPYGFGASPKAASAISAGSAATATPAVGTATAPSASGGCPYGFGAPKRSVLPTPTSEAPMPMPPHPPVVQTTAAAGRCPFGHGGSGVVASVGTAAISSPQQLAASTGCPMGFSAVPAPTPVGTTAATAASSAGGNSGGCPMGYGAVTTTASTATTTAAVPTESHCQSDRVVTNGGRVLAVTGIGATLKEAVDIAYAGVRAVHFEGMHYRTDIARRGLKRPLRIGVVGSTRGTSLQPVIDAIAHGTLNATIALVVSNKLHAGILDRARHHNLPHLHIGAANKSREQFDAELCATLDAEGVDLVLLIGYMRIASPVFTRHFQQRCVNVHPSLLPEFAGEMDLDVHAAVLAAHKLTSGCTVHFVTDEVDGGPILVQKTCAVDFPEETAESLKEKVQALEGAAFIEVIQMFINGDVRTLPAMARAAQSSASQDVCPVIKHGSSTSAAVATTKPAAAMEKSALSYRASGVDIDAGEALVEAIKPYCRTTMRSGCDTAELGGFGGLFDLAASGYAAADTVLVSGTDGVGTKLKIAQAVNKHDTIGIDLVAMCVNDILVCGAEPLFFLDYYAAGALNVTEAALVVKGIAQGCKQAGCALIGGETAEMAGMYRSGEYDLAGFSVGAVRRSDILPRLTSIHDGDVIIALRSSGVHSNGFSLVRKCVEQAGLQWTDAPPFESPHATLGEALLEPTRIYVQELLTLARRKFIKAMAHITGGGLTDNIPRVLPPHLRAVLNAACPEWSLPPVFRWLQSVAQLPQEEMLRTFNCGIGMVLIVDRVAVPAIMHELHESASKPFIVGSVRARPVVPQGEHSPQVVVVGKLE